MRLAKAGVLGDVYTTGITGSTGAGQSLSATTHFSWRANNISPYKTLTHQHNAEIIQSLLHNHNFKDKQKLIIFHNKIIFIIPSSLFLSIIITEKYFFSFG